MEELQQISTETWQLLMPASWPDPQPEESGALYFQAPGETMGFYIATWSCNPADYNRRNKDAIDHFRQVECESLDEMPDNRWEIVTDETISTGDDCTAIIDGYDQGNGYRIVAKIIASLPWVVRFSFHDYHCEKYDTSKAYTDPIIASLEIRTGKTA